MSFPFSILGASGGGGGLPGGRRRAGPRARPGGRRKWLDRWTFLAGLTLLGVWSVCLWVLTAEALGGGWVGMVQAAATELAAAAAVLCLLGPVGRAISSPAGRFGFVRGGEGLSKARRAELESRRLRRLVAAACAACAVGGVISVACIPLASAAMASLGRMFLFPEWLWAVVRLVPTAMVMLPLGAAAAALAAAGALLRRYGPSDPSRHVDRDLAWAACAALTIAAGLGWGGLDFLGAGLVCAVLLAGLAAGMAAPAPPGATTVRQDAGPAPGQPARRRLNVCLWAAPAWLLTVQCWALRNAAGAGWAASLLWTAATAAIAAAVAARYDRRVRVGGASEAWAAGMGGLLVAAVQLAMLHLAAGPGRARWLWIIPSFAGLVPFAGLWAAVLSRRRRVSAREGLPGRLWLADMGFGAALGAVSASAMVSLPVSPTLLAGTLLVLLAATAAAGRTSLPGAGERRAGPARSRARWMLLGAAALAAVALMLFGL